MQSAEKPLEDRDRAGFAAWAVVVVATLGMSVSYVDRQTLAAIAPSVTKALAIDNKEYGLLVAAFSMAYLVGSPLAGIAVDRFGPRRSFATAVVLWSIVAGTHALAPSFGALFALRVLLGLAESPSFPSAVQAIRRAMPGARRALAYGLLFTGSSLGVLVAAKLSVRLNAAYGFRMTFLVTALIGSSWLPCWLVVTRGQNLAPAKTPPPSSRPSASSWTAVVTSPPVLRTVVAVVGAAPLLMYVQSWTAKYLVEAWKLPQDSIGNLLVWPPLVFDIGAVGIGYLANRLSRGRAGSPRILFVLAMLMSASLVLAPFAPSPRFAIAIFALSTCGGGCIYVLATNDMMARVPLERTSTAGGIGAAAQSLAHIITGPLIGWTIDRTHGHNVALIALGGIVVPTSLAFLFWPGLRGAEAPSKSG